MSFVVGVVLVAVWYFWPRKRVESNNPLIRELLRRFAALKPEYGDIQIGEGNSSYSENKEFMILCLVDPKTGRYYDINILTYVALHELAHMISSEYGHGEQFKKNFAQLLESAHQKGVYDPNQPIPSDYCGLDPENTH